MLLVEDESVLSMLESADASWLLDAAAVLPTLVRRLASSRKCWIEAPQN